MPLTDLEAYTLKTLQLSNRAESKINTRMPLIFVMDDELQLAKAERRNKALFKLLDKATIILRIPRIGFKGANLLW